MCIWRAQLFNVVTTGLKATKRFHCYWKVSHCNPESWSNQSYKAAEAPAIILSALYVQWSTAISIAAAYSDQPTVEHATKRPSSSVEQAGSLTGDPSTAEKPAAEGSPVDPSEKKTASQWARRWSWWRKTQSLNLLAWCLKRTVQPFCVTKHHQMQEPYKTGHHLDLTMWSRGRWTHSSLRYYSKYWREKSPSSISLSTTYELVLG